MIGKLFSVAASKLAGETVDGIARRAIWGGLAAVFLLFAFALALMIAYWVLEPQFGDIRSAIILAAGCAIAGLLALAVPKIMDGAGSAAKAVDQQPVSAAQSVAALNQEVDAAVDYFGAVQVVASAFMFGLGTARQLRRKA